MNIQKINMVGPRDSNGQPKRYGVPCNPCPKKAGHLQTAVRLTSSLTRTIVVFLILCKLHTKTLKGKAVKRESIALRMSCTCSRESTKPKKWASRGIKLEKSLLRNSAC